MILVRFSQLMKLKAMSKPRILQRTLVGRSRTKCVVGSIRSRVCCRTAVAACQMKTCAQPKVPTGGHPGTDDGRGRRAAGKCLEEARAESAMVPQGSEEHTPTAGPCRSGSRQ